MKRVVIFNVLLIYLIIFCPTVQSAQDDITFISGKVTGIGEGALIIGDREMTLDADGRFEHRFELGKPSYVLFNVNESVLPLFLVPRDSLDIMVDASRFYDSMRIRGRGWEVNDFLVSQAIESNKLQDLFRRDYQRIYRMDERDFMHLVDSLETAFTERLEVFLGSHMDVHPYFTNSQRAILTYSAATGLLEYEILHRRLTGNEDFSPSDQYYSFLDALDFNAPDLLDIREYRSFLDAYVAVFAGKLMQDSAAYEGRDYKEFRAKYDVAVSRFTDPTVRSEMLYSIMRSLYSEYNIKGTEDLLEGFRANCTNEAYLDEIEKMYEADRKIRDKCEVRIFKTVDDVTLDAFIYRPEGSKPGERRTALAFFHGGGWGLGKPEWGDWQCGHFASLGLVSISFEYRLMAQHDVTPVECIADAKSAVRWMRTHAHDLGIDPERIVVSGFSAGGHIGLCTAMIDKFDEPGEDQSISSAGNAFLLWVTPAKILGDDWFRKILRGKATVEDCDPSKHIRPGFPPSVFFQGTADDTVPPWSVRQFVEGMVAAGNRCDLHMYEGQTHLRWGENADDVLGKMEAFLVSIGLLED
ncbi:MAG: alpha/beta hydrolase [bacterium]|nr:MAG: alpha/beta hydrolase [bacterium]